MAATGSVGISLGILAVFVLGAVTDWTYVALATSMLAVFCLAGFLFYLPESPAWLVLKGKTERAEQELIWLRGQDYNPEKELLALAGAKEDAVDFKKWREILRLFTQPAVYKPVLLINFMMAFMTFSGGNVVIFYAVSIIQVGKEEWKFVKLAYNEDIFSL